jgi:hypothetical protein
LEDVYILFERSLKYIIYIVYFSVFKRNLSRLFLNSSILDLGGICKMLLERSFSLEESIYSINIFFSVAKEGYCFKKEPPPREMRYLPVITLAPPTQKPIISLFVGGKC